jgi:hypothetical protein
MPASAMLRVPPLGALWLRPAPEPGTAPAPEPGAAPASEPGAAEGPTEEA